MGVAIVGTGKALPELRINNKKLTAMVDTDEEWIYSRTGIAERPVATTETALSLAVEASRKALGWDEDGWCIEKIDKDTIDLVIFATVSPDSMVPSMGALLKKELGLSNAVAFDLNSACSGFVYSVLVGEGLIRSGVTGIKETGAVGTNGFRRALIVGAERLSKIVDWTDRGTCILFGDGAGAAVLEWVPDRLGIMGTLLKNYDDTDDALVVGMKYEKTPFDTLDEPNYNEDMHIRMKGTKVFRFAVRAITELTEKILSQNGLTVDDVKYFVPHQANMRIIQSVAQYFKQPMEKFELTIKETGNTSAASVPIALAQLMESGKVASGDKILLLGFGGGLSAGAVLFEAM